MRTHLLATGLALILAVPAHADGFFTVDVQAEYDDVVFNVEQVITNQGLVIDNVSFIGEMLSRTMGDVGSEKKLFANAQVFSFCSATVSREVMEAKFRNIQFCPYGIYVYQTEDGGPVTVGYREFNEPTMQPVNHLLQQIVAESARFD